MGISDAEITEAIQVAESVGAGVIWAMANRAQAASEAHWRWWDKAAVERALNSNDGTQG
jgi:hypothetical protein